jgi:hypothetical protein
LLTEKYWPNFDVREYHETRVNASADAAYDALCSLDVNRPWIVRTLFAIRKLPRTTGGQGYQDSGNQRTTGQLLENG